MGLTDAELGAKARAILLSGDNTQSRAQSLVRLGSEVGVHKPRDVPRKSRLSYDEPAPGVNAADEGADTEPTPPPQPPDPPVTRKSTRKKTTRRG